MGISLSVAYLQSRLSGPLIRHHPGLLPDDWIILVSLFDSRFAEPSYSTVQVSRVPEPSFSDLEWMLKGFKREYPMRSIFSGKSYDVLIRKLRMEKSLKLIDRRHLLIEFLNSDSAATSCREESVLPNPAGMNFSCTNCGEMTMDIFYRHCCDRQVCRDKKWNNANSTELSMEISRSPYVSDFLISLLFHAVYTIEENLPYTLEPLPGFSYNGCSTNSTLLLEWSTAIQLALEKLPDVRKLCSIKPENLDNFCMLFVILATYL